MTQRNLELTVSLQDSSRKNTLLDILDHTQTPMGGRLMQTWVKQPLLSVSDIQQRQQGIHDFLTHETVLNSLREKFLQIKDIERLMIKIGSGYATPREIMALHHSFAPLASIKALLAPLASPWIQNEVQKLDPLPDMNHLIVSALVDEPRCALEKGKFFGMVSSRTRRIA